MNLDSSSLRRTSSELLRFKQRRRSFATAELCVEIVQVIGSSRTDERHSHRNAVLEPK